jgi:hypothetical protein
MAEAIALFIGLIGGWGLCNVSWHAHQRDRERMETAREKRKQEMVREMAKVTDHGAGARPFTWPPKACPCGSVQRDGCEEHGCEWERDPSLVPESLRSCVVATGQEWPTKAELAKWALEAIEAGPNAAILMNLEGIKDHLRRAAAGGKDEQP